MSMALIRHIELDAVTDEIVLDNIPADYTDLKIVYSLRTNSKAEATWFGTVKLNTTTAGNRIRLYGDGSNDYSTSASTAGGVFYYNGSSSTSSTYGNGEIYIANYLSNADKSISIESVTENNGTLAYAVLSAGIITLASPVTSVTLLGGEANDYAIGSSVTIYGITAGSDGTTVVS